MANAHARRNPYTDIWMNLSVCAACEKALEKDGRHRKHDCKDVTITGSAVTFCGCECKAVTTRFIEAMQAEPFMAF